MDLGDEVDFGDGVDWTRTLEGVNALGHRGLRLGGDEENEAPTHSLTRNR